MQAHASLALLLSATQRAGNSPQHQPHTRTQPHHPTTHTFAPHHTEPNRTTLPHLTHPPAHPPSRRPKEKQAQADQKKAKFHQPEGDHLTLLAVYEGWKNSKFSNPWCYEAFVQVRRRPGGGVWGRWDGREHGAVATGVACRPTSQRMGSH